MACLKKKVWPPNNAGFLLAKEAAYISYFKYANVIRQKFITNLLLLLFISTVKNPTQILVYNFYIEIGISWNIELLNKKFNSQKPTNYYSFQFLFFIFISNVSQK